MVKGRKPLSDSRKSETPIRVRVTDLERATLETAAKIADKAVSTWLRDLGLEAARALIAAQPKPPKPKRAPRKSPPAAPATPAGPGSKAKGKSKG